MNRIHILGATRTPISTDHFGRRLAPHRYELEDGLHALERQKKKAMEAVVQIVKPFGENGR